MDKINYVQTRIQMAGYSPRRVKLFLFVLFMILTTTIVRSQNIVLQVTGKALVNGQAVKTGDNLSNDAKVVFDDPGTELKVLSQVGICVIKYKNYDQQRSLTLLELIKSSIRKNSVATRETRTWKINPGKEEQVKLVGAMCQTLKVTKANVNDMFNQYITPYCVLEFETPYWEDIVLYMKTQYGFDPPRLTGALFSPEEYQNIPMVPKVRSLTPLPSSASLKPYCPIPGSQGPYGMCTAWASAYACRTISWAIRNNLTDVNDITNQAFSPTFIYTLVTTDYNVDCKSGSNPERSARALKMVGAVFHSDLPYQCHPDIMPFMQQAKQYALRDYQRLNANSDLMTKEDLDNIKRALVNKNPVLCGTNNEPTIFSIPVNGVASEVPKGHAMCIIGYDDNFNNRDGTFGAVEIMNSWGTDWGNGGFIYVKYNDLTKVLVEAIAFYDDARPEPPPEPPKPLPDPPPPPDILNRMEGSFTLQLRNGTSMQLDGDDSGFRNLKLVTAEKMTYNIATAYPAGTLFRINFTSSQPAYVYVISTDARRSPIAQLFPDPDRNISALLDFKSAVSVSIPDEAQFIALDETPGEDYMCIIYSKEELNINAIKSSFQNNAGKSFVRIVKEALADKIVDDDEVTFEKNEIAFKAASKEHTAVPIFIKIKHI